MPRIATLHDNEKKKDTADESGRNVFTGGYESGQMVERPQGDSSDGEGDNVFNEIMKRARDTTSDDREFFQRAQQFRGAGYRLGDEETATAGPSEIADFRPEPTTRTLTFYANGFAIDDGELRAFDDPANRTFLEEISKGYVPQEMVAAGSGPVDVRIVDKKGEEYSTASRRPVPFSGEGNVLRAASTSGVDETADQAPDNAEVPPNAQLRDLDESQPTTSIQIRLADGTRLVAKFNLNQTVADIRQFINMSRPGPSENYDLIQPFPRKIFSDVTATIESAGLKNASLTQSMK